VENREDPDNPQPAAADNCGNHREDGLAHSAQHVGGAVHAAADKVEGDDDEEAACTGGQGSRGFRQIDPEQRHGEETGESAERGADDDVAQDADSVDTVKTFIPSGTEILSGKSHAALRKGVHRGIDEALQRVGGGIACDVGCPKRID